MGEPEAVPLTTGELAARLRISFRQLDWWVRRGYLPISDDHPGSGVRRLWSSEEARRAAVFAALTHAGFTPIAAGDALRTLILGDDGVGFALWIGPLMVVGQLPPILGAFETDVVCPSCGNDTVAYGRRLCLDCLEAGEPE